MPTIRRRSPAPLALFTLWTFLGTLLPARWAGASPEGSTAVRGSADTSAPVPSSTPQEAEPVDPTAIARPKGLDPQGAPDPREPQSLPSGADKTGVSSQAISMPQGTGKLQGMGESFSAQLSTGIATYAIPIALPAARGAAQPSLGLTYSSAGGQSSAGVGWTFGVPYVARQTDRGLPAYRDPAPGGDWHAGQDRFVFNGGQELVPICTVSGGTCTGALPDEAMPAWAHRWQYFRPRVESGFLRFFWSPDHRTWRIQSKSGETMELGVPLDDSDYVAALESDPDNAAHIFRWNLVRHYDAQGGAASADRPRPPNVVVYRWWNHEGVADLTDVYDTPPAESGGDVSLSRYAHHARLRYAPRPDPSTSYRRGWAVRSTNLLVGIDVTSKPFAGGVMAPRELLRRVHLSYDPQWHTSLLTSVQVEGRCEAPIAEDGGGALPATTCPRLPAMTFEYHHVRQAPGELSDAPGSSRRFEAFDETLRTLAGSPPHSVDEALTDLFDVDADGLPDVLVTAPALFGGKHGVFFNRRTTFVPSTMAVAGVLGADEGVLTLKNPHVVPKDLDGDGRVDLVHMPMAKRYAVYSAQAVAGQWTWVGRDVATASGQDPRIDWSRDAADLRTMDVDGDGLVDVVRSSGTRLQTFFSLGRYPGGDGQLGHGRWTSSTTADISNDSVDACLPWSGGPVHLGDPDVRVADLNGDGLPDLVRIRRGDVRYWPGRGNGLFGTGRLDDCPAGTFGAGRAVEMSAAPPLLGLDDGEVRLDDVNGDGLDDLVRVRFNAVDVWLNIDGVGWTDRHVIAHTPPATSGGARVRVVDVNGSGTRDLVWGDAFAYQYMDLLGGARPWVLTKVSNGLGKTTELEYTNTTNLMLAAEVAGQPWTSRAPMPIHVLSRVTDRDNLSVAGRPSGVYTTEYTYRDPVYDGLQREFRGFRSVRETRVGDANSPTAITDATFLLGECASRCGPEDRWRDNPREALKGLPRASESSSDAGVYAGSSHHTYRLRVLYTGQDGRAVTHAFEEATDSYAYDTAGFTRVDRAQTATEVNVERGGAIAESEASSLTLRSASRVTHTRDRVEVDRFGNTLETIAEGCVDGCPEVDETITSTTLPGRPAGDGSGWMWRTVETWVSGSRDPAARRRHLRTEYDWSGQPLATFAEISGTLPLDRFHEAASPVAPAPPGTGDRTVMTSLVSHDGLGNVTFAHGAGGRCRAVDYDPDYRHFATTETVFVGGLSAQGTCGSVPLTSTATYDRGLGEVTTVLDLHGELSLARYDGFGRLTERYRPHPTAVGMVSARPSVVVDYMLGDPYSVVRTRTHDGLTDDDDSYREAWALSDGFGRTLVTLEQADPAAGDGGQWVARGLTEYDRKGAAQRVYLAWFFGGGPTAFPLSTAPNVPFTRHQYDAFGREVRSFGLDGAVVHETRYHADSVDRWDAADLLPGPHQGTFASSRQDGHGRTVVTTERVHVAEEIEAREVRTTYLPTGEPAVITRVRVGKPDSPVVRWLRYDSFGRMVLNVEPSTTKGFDPNPGAPPSAMKAWRYAYDDAGDLVGTSDARGCGTNTHYDTGGRLVAEDYSPCLRSHAPYTAPDLVTGAGTEVWNLYDVPDPELASAAAADPTFTVQPALFQGRLASTADRAAKTLTRYDGRGRATGTARRLARPGSPSEVLASRYTGGWFTQQVAYDAADRPIVSTTGAKVPELLGANGKSELLTSYTKRGDVKAASSSYGDLVRGVVRDADERIESIVYGDLARTRTDLQYDARRRLSAVQTYRGPPAAWTATPATITPSPDGTTTQAVLADGDFVYDEVDNPVAIRDFRPGDGWPAGAKPVTRRMEVDDLNRVQRVEYQYTEGDDPWVSPFAHENAGGSDPRRAKPSPHVSFVHRVRTQVYGYDWLGNTTWSADDARGFYDRSLGTIANDTYRLTGAVGETSPRDGRLSARYDDAGNLVSLVVRRSGPCLPVGAVCSQRFAYEWDEVGRLSRARRWDLSDPGEAGDPAPEASASAELRYAYDAEDDRTLKTAVDGNGQEVHTAYVFPTLELRRARFVGGEYERTMWTEVPYLFAHGVRVARVHYGTGTEPGLTSGRQHVLLELQDFLGSSALTVDLATSEVVEKTTYQAYGATESDYRPERWEGAREDYRFTGKEEDVEVGIQYFGKRYYAPLLGRWLSADPLTVHGLGADLNAYAYVHGRVFVAVDPVGLDWTLGKLWDAGVQTTKAIVGGGVDSAKGAAVALGQGLAHGAETAVQNGADLGKMTVAAVQGDVATLASTAESYKNRNVAVGTGILAGTKAGFKQAGDNLGEGAYRATHGDVAGGTRQFVTGAHQGTQQVIQYATAAAGAGRALGGGRVQITAPRAPPPARAVPPRPAPPRAPAAAPCSPCFVAGTLVETPRGAVAIEDVRVGDEVLSESDETGELGFRRVDAVTVTEDRPIVRMALRAAGGASESLDTTPEHPFWAPGFGWKRAGELGPGDELRAADGSRLVVVSLELRSAPGRVFNFEVRGFHTYFVGRLRAWVHNECPPAGGGASLQPYGGPGGGHHVPAKNAFKGAAGYDPKAALAIPNAELVRLNVRHPVVTGAQAAGYRAFAATGQPLTWEAAATIETNALIKGGMNAGVAAATVKQAIDALKAGGVTGPTRIPWGG